VKNTPDHETQTAKALKAATIPVKICSECFSSVPAEQIEQHLAWHAERSATVS
jgi:uncharacterized protein YlaI